MYRVLIVDDEKEIREGLRSKFPWSEFNVDQVETAEDGDIALDRSMAWRPDLIISDIKMNRMSGLEFIRQLNEEVTHDCKSIVVSGYDDFDLVRSALQLGAVDYILKPINTDELKRVVNKALEQLKKERSDSQSKLLLENQLTFALPKLQEEAMREITENPYDPYWETRLRNMLINAELDWILQEPLALMVIEVDDLKSIELGRVYRKEKELVLFSLGNVVKQTCEEEYPFPYVMFRDANSRWVVVLACHDLPGLQACKVLARKCIERINQYVKVKASIGLQSAKGSVKSLYNMFHETSNMLEHKIVYGGNRLLVDEEIGGDGVLSGTSASNSDVIFDLIKYGSESDITEALGGFDEMVRSWPASPIKNIQQQLFEWLLEVYKKAAAIGLQDPEWDKNPIAIWDRLEQYDTMDSLRAEVGNIVLGLSRAMKRQVNPHNQIVAEAVKYISRNFDRNLTLQGVASEVHVTPVWLSKLFKKETRQTFLEYVTSLRMEKSKEMLGDVRYKIYQVSQAVGYRDPVHFSKLFRKIVGCTPKEYRRMRGVMDE